MSIIDQNNIAGESISIFLNSDEAELSITSSHKKFYLSELISVNPDTNILIGLTSFECPYSFYTIRQGINDQITLGFDTASYPSGEFRTSFIPEGNYDIDDFLIVLASLNCFIASGISITFNNKTNKLTLTRAGAYNKIAFTISTTCYTELGIPKNQLINLGLTGVLNLTTPLTLGNTINLAGSSCIYVRINNLGIKNLNSRGDSDGIIGKVSCDVLPNEFIYFNPAEYFYYITNKSQIRELDIDILDDQNRRINLNGGVYSLSLSLKFSYKSRQRFIRGYYIKDPEVKGSVPLEPPLQEEEADTPS